MDDPFFYRQMTSGNCYPLAVECQQSTTIAAITRGFDQVDFLAGLNAGGSSGRPMFDGSYPASEKGRTFGKWHAPSTNPGMDVAKALSLSPPMAPGTVLEFLNGDVPNKEGSGAHIAFVLRVSRQHNLMQAFDTSALWLPFPFSIDRGLDVTTCARGVTFDDPWCGRWGAFGAFTGMGVLPTDRDVAGAVSRASHTWPVGVARLVIRDRASDKVLYSTPLLRMHFNDFNFSPARYAWSLRNIPRCKTIKAVWELSFPVGSTASSLINRDATSRIGGRRPFTLARFSSRPGFPAEGAKISAFNLKCHSDISVDAGGKVHVTQLGGQRTGARYDVAWDARAVGQGVTPPPLDNSIPRYLRGGEGDDDPP